ncbi:sugar transferase [Aquimarina longa]|uniref:sugar transferase n=1 Tax=Aquimarina longa TaxID=1080221 RepID=UPI000781826D|nr:sugar transferase [Aquimarina longa]
MLLDLEKIGIRKKKPSRFLSDYSPLIELPNKSIYRELISTIIDVVAHPFKNKKIEVLNNSIALRTKPYVLRGNNKVTIRKIISKKLGNNVCDFIANHIEGYKLFDVQLCDTRKKEDILSYRKESYPVIINLQKANDYLRINKFFEAINKKLPEGGVFINTVEVYDKRKERILMKYPKPLNYIYYIGDFIVHRILPKLKLTKSLYFRITKGYGRVLTKAEILGRLYSCGFDVIEEKLIDDQLYFIAKKEKQPIYDMNPTYGPLIRLKRVGKNKKSISVYKFRTMHPYSEYLQPYVFNKNNLRKGGKLNNDFRISNIGKILRKYWIDELPMILNFIKGDMKLIGGRPLSNHYFSLYTKELQEKRVRFKPGLIPPFYADMPETLEEIMESEMRYLEEYEKNPFFTDINYLLKIVKNIVFKGKRSL